MPRFRDETQLGLFGGEDQVGMAAHTPVLAQIRDTAAPHVGAGEFGDTADMWLQDPLGAFREWTLTRRVSQRQFNQHSVRQYASMFGAFLRWLAGSPGRTLCSADSADIEQFIATKTGRDKTPASATTRRRYLHLVSGVYARLVELGLREDNPVEPLIGATRPEDVERPAPTVLSEALMSRYIRAALARAEPSWVDCRDKALRVLFLASGITVGELQRLAPADLQATQSPPGLTLRVTQHGFVAERLVPIAGFAHKAVLHWAQTLRTLAPHSTHLFAARCFGFNIDRPDVTAVSSPECYTIVQTVLNEIGYDRERQGPQTLRNSFIARQIWEGHETARITSWIGLKTNETVNKIAKLVPLRADGVVPA